MRRLSEPIARVGLVANPEKVHGRSSLRRVVRLVTATGREVLTEPATAQMGGLGVATLPTCAELAAQADVLLVFGGDGTILEVARQTAGHDAPLFGINLGTLGFLTACTTRRLSPALDLLWAGQCLVESRSLIEAENSVSAPPIRELALNDFVISRGTVPRLIELEVRVDGNLLTCYRGDGLIVSSPTGSTAYSLAAGGAVVSPQADVFALTPICPHTLSNRSVILSLSSTVQVRLHTERVETFLAADGQTRAKVLPGDTVDFRRSVHTAHLVRLPGVSFFDTLRQKMSWSGSAV